MISKAKIKYICSLQQKKNRNNEGIFVAEGPKVVGDFQRKRSPLFIACTQQWLAHNGERVYNEETEVNVVTEDELKKVSFLQHPQEVLALFRQENSNLKHPDTHHLYLALDGVQDPGNLGTIIRIADWFGIEQIFCSEDTADIYNPKVVQATMGSLSNVQVNYTNLAELIDDLPADYPVYGTVLDGNNIYSESLTPYGIIVMGNEGKGISHPIRNKITHRILIPNFPQDRETTDSLNVAIATALTCGEFRRRRTLI